MIAVYRPQTLIELAVAESLLEANGIPYFVHNGGFGSLYPGIQVELYNARTIMVPPSAAADAKDLLAHYLSDTPALVHNRERSIWHILRMVLEAGAGWGVPRVGAIRRAA
ncbi:MAG TPA: DUF2007 domain-containing protein [Burkholderiales bacterium]|nr:DUF2007 domain-containing protein [Burkholderiales bacterium]